MSPDVDATDLRTAARELVAAEVAVALTGAGVSTESGIPDFRSDGGVWDDHDESEFTVSRFHADPGEFWEDWLDLKDRLLPPGAEPNAAHRSLAALESGGHLDAVLTQNVDGLHRAAGSRNVVELHGNATRAACRGCDASFDAAVVEERARDGPEPPRCENCGEVCKPDAVLFGERLPDVPLRTARKLTRKCDVMVVVGSSLTVDPVGSLPGRAVETGATLVVINDEPTRAADVADVTLRGRAGDVVPALASAVVEER